ncbi:YqhV family protein [Halalkalibacter hemicellulosilyticus]|uniref:DUF2619 domain-containing protein n=1 Tax=Halalkalibacter hemicellulosilyticusJCM 9152 TaxID=1236971 RepID=W4QIB0_9BACI|nr:YqhV family protein [Halalkalibacter hemicellulosilyticus]GAE31865.1 hypothetical protein JCM9152_3360 [Halalkalibacter hemicellulosilyticusJCM 9152]
MKTWFFSIEVALLIMVGLRLVSGLIELTAAALMLRLNSVEKAIAVNAALAIIGPTILILSISIGLIGMKDQLSFIKVAFIASGVTLILIGLAK